MKKKNALFVLSGLLIAGNMFAQNVTVIEGGADKNGLLEATINGDTTETGARVDPNRIYELKAGAVYYQNKPIIVNNPDGVLTIRGQKGGAKPVIIKQPLLGVAVGENNINSNLTFLNIQYENMETDGNLPNNAFNITGNNHTLRVEDCLIENSSLLIFMAGWIKNGAKFIYRNNYFRDMMDFSQWWGARIGECKHDIDSLIFENNTITGAGLLWLSQKSVTNVAIINHNTIINNHKYPFLNPYWRECYFTNNLFVNANMVGEDIENVATSDPNGYLTGIFEIDTIEKGLDMPLALMNPDSTPGSSIDEISDYIIYNADNVVTYSPTLDYYYNGSADKALVPSLPWDDAPASYLTWRGLTPPFKVVNVPTIWENSRALQLFADNPNIKEENNHIYETGYQLADLGMATDPLSQAAADIFVQWDQAQWGVPGAVVPIDRAAYYFGDYDPTTIPGADGEVSAAGITKFSDLAEDFSYSANLISHSDGRRIGALHWNDEEFNSQSSLTAVKNAYNGIYSAVKPVLNENLYVYPNPANDFLYLKGSENADITILNMDGRVVRKDSHVSSMRVSDLADGMYSVTIKTENGISMQKIIIQGW